MRGSIPLGIGLCTSRRLAPLFFMLNISFRNNILVIYKASHCSFPSEAMTSGGPEKTPCALEPVVRKYSPGYIKFAFRQMGWVEYLCGSSQLTASLMCFSHIYYGQVVALKQLFDS